MGKTAKEYMDRGDLVPDEVIVGVIAERIDSVRRRPTGSSSTAFPAPTRRPRRSTEAGELGRSVSGVLLIDVSDEEVMRRLGGRRTCAENGHVFHVEFNPPKREGVCDLDGSPLVVRDDDKPEVIRKRLETYHDKTEPLVELLQTARACCAASTAPRRPTSVEEEVRRTLATLKLEADEAI